MIPDDHAPRKVKSTINEAVAIKSWAVEKIKAIANQMPVAKTAPAVPGAIGK